MNQIRICVLAAAMLVLGCGAARAQNLPPAQPTVTEPQLSRIVNPSDVHMETAPFSDPNPGDTHLCTDWEIWRAGLTERVWVTFCIGGVERVHTHLGDGVFEGSHAGRRTLFPATDYVLRVRHRDSSNNPASEWSPWAERPFTTGTLSQVFPLELDDVLLVPTPSLSDLTGAPIDLFSTPTPASVRLENVNGEQILEFRGQPGGGLLIINPAPLPTHEFVRVVVGAGSARLTIPEADMTFTEDSGNDLTLYLPAIDLAAGATATFWLSSNGSSYVALPGQSVPDFTTLARGASVPWTTAPGFRVEVVATGFQLPVNIAFVPNPDSAADAPLYYVMELYGAIKVVRRNGIVSDYATGLLNFNPTGNFPGSGEQGAAGLAVDPLNGDLYATLLYSEVPGVANAPHHPAVERFTSTDGGLTAATRTRILDMAPEEQGQSHQISNISFGPDGFLYVHVGDGFDAGAAQDLNFFRGKILRINRFGMPVPSNPFYNATNGITATDYIYAYGYRNPFGGAWRFRDNAHYTVENGPSVDRFSRLVFGRNMLWDGTDESMRNFALYNWDPATAPVNIAFPQPEVFAGSRFPADLLGRAYVTQSGGTYGVGPGNNSYKTITEWVIDDNGVLTDGPRSVATYNGGGASSAVAIASGPDGLYFSDLYREDPSEGPIARGANVLRLRWIGLPPAADCDANGISDADEIAAGAPDCNNNGIPDACDVAAGRSQDCNQNNIPDECEVLTTVTQDFSSGLGQWVVNGDATLVNGAVRLTRAENNLIGTLILPGPAAPLTGFDVSFDFRIGGGSGADGLSFATFDANIYGSNILFSEEGPGAINEARPGPGTLVVSFDTYDNGGEGENSITVAVNGNQIASFAPPFSLEDNANRRARITFRDGQLTVVLTGPQGRTAVFNNLLLTGYVPFPARFGFGGRTGGLTNEHVVDNISFAEPNIEVDFNTNGIPDTCEQICLVDFNADNFLNQEDLGGYITTFLDESNPPGPSGTSRSPCPGAPAPYNTLGYAADFNRDCGLTQEDLGGFITEYFGQIENPTGCVPG